MTDTILDLDVQYWRETKTHPATAYAFPTSDLARVVSRLNRLQDAKSPEISAAAGEYADELIKLATEAGRSLIAYDYAEAIALMHGLDEPRSDISKIISSAVGGPPPESMGADGLVEILEARKIRCADERLLAILILRLLAAFPAFVSNNSELRLGAIKIFEDQLQDIAKIQNIETRAQTYEKMGKWRTVIPLTLSQLPAKEIGQVRTLDQLIVLRSTWMKCMRSRLASAIFPHLASNALCDHWQNLFFHSLDQFSQASPSEFRSKYSDAADTIKSYADECLNHGTFFSRAYLLPLATTALRALGSTYKESDLIKPAQLSVRASPKKYSLEATPRDVDIRLIVENIGKGPAEDVRIHLEGDTPLYLDEQYLGHIPPGTLEIQIPAILGEECPNPSMIVQASWRNTDGNSGTSFSEFSLETQRLVIDWEVIQSNDPYSLAAVQSQTEFIGRKDALDQLRRQALGKSVGSAYIFGQRRVGKTSLSKALSTELERNHDFITIAIVAGDFLQGSPESSVNQLGFRLSERIKRARPIFRGLKTPSFEGALSPLTSLLEEVEELAPNQRWLFIIDEFDNLQADLYKEGPFAVPLFSTLRAISHKTNFGFLLVGGEKMEHIFHFQGEQLNNFKSMRLDYFDRQSQWNDFVQLVRRPTQDVLEFNDEAVALLHEQTAGNPYFTKMLCGEVFHLMVNRHDFHVTPREIKDATAIVCRDASENYFQHFWKDGIFAVGDEVTRIEMLRKKVLLAMSRLLQSNTPVTRKSLTDQFPSEALAGSLLDEFVRRHIFEEAKGNYRCKVRLFERWLVERGHRQLALSFHEQEVFESLQKADLANYIGGGEIIELISKWGTYQGQPVTEERVRAWLNQFEGVRNQRLMFQVLNGVRFYNQTRVREALREAHDIMLRDLGRVIQSARKGFDRKQRFKREDVLVSYLDGPGKSGSAFAKLFADENDIYYKNIWEQSQVNEYLKNGASDQRYKAIVFVDDFVGTGKTAQECLDKMFSNIADDSWKDRTRIFFLVVCGFQEGLAKVKQLISDKQWPVEVHTCELLHDSDRCFDKASPILNESDRQAALKVAQDAGERLEKKQPLGYGNLQSLVVFADNCPNNSLPILWKQKAGWIPLFPRQ